MKESPRYVIAHQSGGWVSGLKNAIVQCVTDLTEAKTWGDKIEAVRFTQENNGMWTIHRLKLSTTPEIITPAEDAEARGDEEFLEFQRLAKKFGKAGTGQCPFNEAWVGKCGNTPEVGELFCERHKDMKCYKCGAQATSNCAHAGQFVCGVPQCDVHNRHHG